LPTAAATRQSANKENIITLKSTNSIKVLLFWFIYFPVEIFLSRILYFCNEKATMQKNSKAANKKLTLATLWLRNSIFLLSAQELPE
jgi:heme/copper-type cytochrome/quinol oxidase subunit 3